MYGWESLQKREKDIQPQKMEEKNRTGIPDSLQKNYEVATGLSLEDVKVHYNSDKPIKLSMKAYAQKNQVYLAPKREDCLEHELNHVIQWKRGLVKPSFYLNEHPICMDEGLEKDADRGYAYFHTQMPSSGADSSAGEEACIQAKWEKAFGFGQEVYINESKKSSLKDLISSFKGQSGLVYLIYLKEKGELYVDGKRMDVEKELIEEDINQDLPEEQNQEEEQDQQQEDREENAIPLVEQYDRLDDDMEYFCKLEKSLAMIEGQGLGEGAGMDVDRFWECVEKEALQRERQQRWQRYQTACEQIKALKQYRRTKGNLYKERIEDRKLYLESFKKCRKPSSTVYEETKKEMLELAAQRLKAEKKRVWESIRYREQIFTSDQKNHSTETMIGSKTKPKETKKIGALKAVEDTRQKLREASLMVLPEGMPLAGFFPKSEVVHIHMDKMKDSPFSILKEQADKLIVKYKLHHGDGGVIQGEAGCVCVMYLKEQKEEENIYRPAFGISGYYGGKGEEGVKAGFEAMGIPEDLLKAKDKPEALKQYLLQCEILGMRKPSMQACLSYLQSAEEYGDIERWKPIMCAEPEIVMAVRYLYHEMAELVLSYPYQGKLSEIGGTKMPVPKYTCARCAVAEKSFGAVVLGEDGKIEREQVRMDGKGGNIKKLLFQKRYIRNSSQNSTASGRPAYMEAEKTEDIGKTEDTREADRKSNRKSNRQSNWKRREEQIRSFLFHIIETGFHHGHKEILMPSRELGKKTNYIRDDNGNPVSYIDPPSMGNNCFFAALQAYTKDQRDAEELREGLRRSLNDDTVFVSGRMVGDRDLETLRRLNPQQFQQILGTTGFTIQIYGNSGLLQSINYGTVTQNTPVLINIGFYHYVLKA